MKQLISKHKIFLCFIILLGVQFLCMIFWGMQKTGFNIDDILSYQLANSFYMPYLELSPDFYNEWHTSDFFAQAISVTSEDTRFVYDSVYYNQTADVHPPLYYFMLHTVSSLFLNVFSKWFGLLVNLFFFVLANFLLYKLSKLVLGNTWFCLLPCVLWGFSLGACSTFLLIRMYMMLSCMVVLYLYLHLRYISNQNMTIWRLGIIIFSVCTGFLTHYYFLIFAFFVTLTECLYRLFQKDIRQMLYYGLTTSAAVLLSFLVYPAAYSHIFSDYRGEESFSNIANVSSYLSHIITSLQNTSLINILGILLGIALPILVIYCNKQSAVSFISKFSKLVSCDTKQVSLRFILLTIPATATFLLVAVLAGFAGDRYLFFMYPLLAAICAVSIVAFVMLLPLSTYKKYATAFALVLCLLMGSWVGTTPVYLDTDSGDAITNAQSYHDCTCIFITDKTWKFAGHYIELTCYWKSLLVQGNNMDALENIVGIIEGPSLIVYVPIGEDPEAYFAAIEETYHYGNATALWSYAYSDVYQLTTLEETL